MRWPWQMHRDLNRRVASAKAEAEESQRIYDQDKVNIIVPLQQNMHRNHFAELIRDTLIKPSK